MMRSDASSLEGQPQELATPYWFSSTARRRQADIQVGDYVRVRGLDKRYELMDIFPKHNSVRVREVGGTGELLIPWSAVTPWKRETIRSQTVIQALGNCLFLGNRVYRLSEPDRLLKQKKINWGIKPAM